MTEHRSRPMPPTGLRDTEADRSTWHAGRSSQQQLDRATPFEKDEQMEHLLRLRTTDPAGFRLLAPNQRIQLGLYEQVRDKHTALNSGDAA